MFTLRFRLPHESLELPAASIRFIMKTAHACITLGPLSDFKTGPVQHWNQIISTEFGGSLEAIQKFNPGGRDEHITTMLET